MESEQFFTKQNVLKLVFESALIIFSVLLALFLNEYRGQLKDNEQKSLALQMVEAELKFNLETINEWRSYHDEVLKNLNHALQSKPLKSSLFTENGLIEEALMPKGVVQRLLDDGAWQTLKASSVASKIDFNTIFTLSKLYKAQAKGVELTLNNILTIISSRDALEKKNQRNTLLLLRNNVKEIVAQEVFLTVMYKQALSEIARQNHDLQ